MPEPITSELPKPQRLTVGETPVYLKKSLVVGGQQVTEITIKGARQRTEKGVGSAMIIMAEKSRRRGEEGKPFTKMLDNINEMEEVDWEKVSAITLTDTDGSTRHLLTRDQLSLVKPETRETQAAQGGPESPVSPTTPTEAQSVSPEIPQPPSREVGSGSARQSPEPKLARRILEQYSGEPTTLTIVGLKAYETRSHDLADKAMQLKTSLGERIWKQGIGPAYFHEQARQYYDAMLKAAQSPFAEQSIKIAEAAGKNRYQELLKNKNFMTRPTRQFIEWMKDTLGVQTLSQKFALEEIAHMRETGEIKEREVFDREAASIRKRFEQDVDIQDGFIRGSLGEKLTILDSNDPAQKQFVDIVKRLVKEYATGDIATKKDFDKVTDELFHKYLKGQRRDVFDQAELYTASLYDVAENLRTKASHEGGLAAIDAQLEGMQVRLGMGVMGEATALVPSDVEKGTKAVVRAVDWMEKKGIIGPFAFNEATVSTAVALSLSLSWLPRTGASMLANGVVSLGGGAAVGGIFAGLREYRHLEKEYLTHLRERESGLTFAPDAKRRAWMEKFMVGQRSADDLINGIRGSVYQPDGTTLKDSLTTDELRTSMANLADAKARRALSGRTDSQRVGLIQFTGRDNIETQRTALDVTITQAEKDLTTYLSSHPEMTGLNPVNSSTGEFITQLTAAQTRILNEGMSRIEGLDDPIKVTLGLLEKYNPEVDIMRRRFPLIGADQKTGAKAQGLEQIFSEFRRAARGEAVKKGLQVGLTSAALGFISREVMQTGLETGAAALTKEPVFGPPVHIGNADYQFANNIQLDNNGNLVANNHTMIAGFENFLKTNGGFNGDGTLTNDAKLALIKEAKDQGISLDIPTAIKMNFAFSGETHSLADPAGAQSIIAPRELHWDVTPEGRQLVLDAKDAQGKLIKQILYNEQGTPDGNGPSLYDILKDRPHLAFTPEEYGNTFKQPHDVILSSLAPITNAEGQPIAIHASIPDGTNLVETKVESGIKVFDLVDAHGKQLLTGIKINNYGVIQSYQALNDTALARANSLNVTMDQFTLFAGPETGSAASGEFTKAVADMGSTPNEHGVWNWMLETMRDDVKHLMPATNLTKNLFRGYEENVIHKANIYFEGNAVDATNLPYGAMGNGYQFRDLPKSLFFDQALPNGKIPLVELGKIMDKAIQMKEVDGTDLEKMDKLYRVAYEIGRVGRVATKDEVELFLQAMGGTGGAAEKTVTLWRPVIEQAATETIPASVVGVSGEHVSNLIALHEAITVPELPYLPITYPFLLRNPLEPFVPLEPYAPPEAPPGELFPLLPRPSSVDNPTPFLSVWDPYGGRPEAYGPYNRRESQKYTHEEIIQYYRSRMHPDLIADPSARPDFQTAARWYLKQLDPQYRTALENINNTIASPMTHDTQLAVCIPVRASQEGKHIYHTLDQYAKQTDLEGNPMDKSKYEIVLFLNAPDKEPLDATMDEVKRFMADHPDMPVRVATGKFPKGAVRYGTYIKYAYDLALLRAMERTNPSQKELFIATGDADLTRMDPNYIASNIAFMNDKNNAHLDAALAAQDLETQALDAYPTFKAALRFSQYQEAQVRQGVPGWNTSTSTGPSFPYVQTQGRTTVLRASTLAAIGGVNDASPAGADIELGRMINFARHGRFANISAGEQTIAYNRATTIETNARRELVTYLSGQPLIHTWSKFDEGEQVRNKSTAELISMSKEKPGTINGAELERQINAFREWDVHMNSHYTSQALSWMGLKEGKDYVIEDDPTEAHKGGQWQKKVTFTSDLSSLSERIKDLPSEPRELPSRVSS
ncbi:MAG: hypothetical protein Q8L37_00245 [Candidatus Gottesmanbacteria bacterium]|nr:hypothetical protein [Candidatus Gottesmanbacteria bacterium]